MQQILRILVIQIGYKQRVIFVYILSNSLTNLLKIIQVIGFMIVASKIMQCAVMALFLMKDGELLFFYKIIS